MKKIAAPLKKLLPVLFMAIGLTACVKDVDLDQVNEISLRPTAVIDLVNFALEADLKENIDPGVPVKVSETIPFDVLTEDLKENVVRIDFRVEHYNSLPRTFKGNIFFLNNRNHVKQQIPVEILPGSIENPEHDFFITSMEGSDLKALHEATQVKVEMEMQPGPGLEGGQLRLNTTAAFQFQF